MYHIGSFSHHALSTCTSAWTIPTYPFIYFGNIDMSTCRPVDLSTCRPVDLVLLSTTNIYICHLYVLPKLNCRLVDLSTCRPSAIVNKKDPVRVRVRLGLVLAILALLTLRLGQ